MSSTNFTVPDKITKIDCFCVGGGGSGRSGGFRDGSQSLIDNIGDTQLLANGGKGGAGGGGDGLGANGGSGGGAANAGTGNRIRSGDGGSDGSDGESVFVAFAERYINGGKGQGTTTRYFGESNGTLYAGGGGGGTKYTELFVGKGGAGGGGDGWRINDMGQTVTSGTAGQANTGGGGGGAKLSNGGGGGGGGGYTATKLGVSVTPGDTIPVVVGAGGIIGTVGGGGSGIAIIRWGK